MKKALVLILLSAIAITKFSACSGTTETNMTGELTIAAFNPMGEISPLLERAARIFESQNDGVTINIIVYDNWDTYAQIINTALLSGGGEDIISTGHIQWQRLADVGRLVDMNDKLVFPPGEFYQNVLDAFLYNDRRYVVPLGFGMQAFHANALSHDENPSVLTLESLVAISNAHPGTLLFQTGTGLGGTPLSIAMMYFELDFNKYVDIANRAVNINNDGFISLLESVQSIAGNIRWAQVGEKGLFMEEFMHSPAMAMNGIVDYSDLIIPTNDDGGGLVWTRYSLGINANSPNQEIAARFIQFLLSDDIQASPEMLHTPVNRVAAVERSRMTMDTVRAFPGYDGITSAICIENNIIMFNHFADRMATIGITDPMIRDFVIAEMRRFFRGEVTAPQAASNLQIRLTTYLNE